MGCLHQIPPLRDQGTRRKKRQNECRCRGHGGHSKNRVLYIVTSKAHMNSQRRRQHAQGLHESIRSSVYKLCLPVLCFYGIPECTNKGVSHSYSTPLVLFLLSVLSNFNVLNFVISYYIISTISFSIRIVVPSLPNAATLKYNSSCCGDSNHCFFITAILLLFWIVM